MYHIRVDPLPWRYDRADEVVHKIVNAQLKRALGGRLIHDIIACDSTRTIGVQVADLLLGAVIATWQQDVEADPKLRTMQWIAEHLGWDDLQHDTFQGEWKFKVWHFFAPPPRENHARRAHCPSG